MGLSSREGEVFTGRLQLLRSLEKKDSGVRECIDK